MMARPKRPASDPARSMSIEVEAPRATDLVGLALDQAVQVLRERREDLYAAEVGRFYPTGRSKFRRHLGVVGHPIGWRATIVVRLRPEVVRERRGKRVRPHRRGLFSVD